MDRHILFLFILIRIETIIYIRLGHFIIVGNLFSDLKSHNVLLCWTKFVLVFAYCAQTHWISWKKTFLKSAYDLLLFSQSLTNFQKLLFSFLQFLLNFYIIFLWLIWFFILICLNLLWQNILLFFLVFINDVIILELSISLFVDYLFIFSYCNILNLDSLALYFLINHNFFIRLKFFFCLLQLQLNWFQIFLCCFQILFCCIKLSICNTKISFHGQLVLCDMMLLFLQ